MTLKLLSDEKNLIRCGNPGMTSFSLSGRLMWMVINLLLTSISRALCLSANYEKHELLQALLVCFLKMTCHLKNAKLCYGCLLHLERIVGYLHTLYMGKEFFSN